MTKQTKNKISEEDKYVIKELSNLFARDLIEIYKLGGDKAYRNAGRYFGFREDTIKRDIKMLKAGKIKEKKNDKNLGNIR